MKVDIHCKGIPLTDAIHDHVHEKLGKLERLLPGEVDILTILGHASRQGGIYSAEVSFRVWGQDVVAKEEDEDMYKAMTAAADQALTQMRKLKGKRTARVKGGETVRNYVPPAPEPDPADIEDEDFVDIELDVEAATANTSTNTNPQ